MSFSTKNKVNPFFTNLSKIVQIFTSIFAKKGYLKNSKWISGKQFVFGGNNFKLNDLKQSQSLIIFTLAWCALSMFFAT